MNHRTDDLADPNKSGSDAKDATAREYRLRLLDHLAIPRPTRSGSLGLPARSDLLTLDSSLLVTALTVTMAMVVVMRMAPDIRRHVGDVAMAHTALGNDVIRKYLHLGAPALEHRDFETAVMVEMNMQRRLREIVVRMEVPGQTLERA